MPAPEADELHIFQMFTACCQDGRSEHPRVVIVHNIQPAPAQIHLVDFWQRIRGQYRDPHGCEQFRKFVVHQGVILVGTGGEHYGERTILLDLSEHLCTGAFQRCMELFLRRFAGSYRRLGLRPGNPEGAFHILYELPSSVFRGIPVEQRSVVGDIPVLLRIVRVADNERIALYYGAHRLAGRLHIFRRNRRDGGHENAVHALLSQVAQMPVHELCRKADRIRGHR